METVTYESDSVARTEETGAALAARLDEIYPERLHFIMLSGPLGAGKTAFTRGLASVWSPGSRVKSPTFTIVNEYRAGDIPLFHFDLYRLGDGADLEDIGFAEYTEGGHCVVEWSEFFSGEIPEGAVTVNIIPDDDGSRTIEIIYPDR